MSSCPQLICRPGLPLRTSDTSQSATRTRRVRTRPWALLGDRSRSMTTPSVRTSSPGGIKTARCPKESSDPANPGRNVPTRLSRLRHNCRSRGLPSLPRECAIVNRGRQPILRVCDDVVPNCRSRAPSTITRVSTVLRSASHLRRRGDRSFAEGVHQQVAASFAICSGSSVHPWTSCRASLSASTL